MAVLVAWGSFRNSCDDGAARSTVRTAHRGLAVVEDLVAGVVAGDEGDAGSAVAAGATEVEPVDGDGQVAESLRLAAGVSNRTCDG